MNLKVKKLNPAATIPTRAHTGDRGLDLYLLEELSIPPCGVGTGHTGIAIEMPHGWGGQVADRSSVALCNVKVAGGVIDNAYRGELQVILHNNDKDLWFHTDVGEKIAQLCLEPLFEGGVEEVTSLSLTERGTRGFGSSDVKEVSGAR